MSEERGNLGANLLLFLAGAAAGAVLVALVTPKSGPELRADLKGLGGRLRRKLRESGFDVAPECEPEAEHEETRG
jgi:gas vesicle protein